MDQPLKETILRSMSDPIAIITQPADQQFVAGRGVVERVHVLGAQQRDRAEHEERDADEDVGRRAAHRGQRADLPGELLPVPHRLGDHVEDAGHAAADLALDRHGRDDEGDVLRADPVRHLGERVVHRPAEPRLGQHALELLARGRLALVHDRLDPLAEAVAGLQRGGQRHQEVGQLVVDRGKPSPRLEPDDADRHGAAGAHREQRHEAGSACDREDDPGDEPGAGCGIDELDGAQRHVGPLEQPVERVPDGQVAEGALRHPHQARRGREALLHRAAGALALLQAEVRRDLAAQARAERRTHAEERCEQDQEADDGRRQRRADLEERLRQLRRLGGRLGGHARHDGLGGRAGGPSSSRSAGRAEVTYESCHVRRSSDARAA